MAGFQFSIKKTNSRCQVICNSCSWRQVCTSHWLILAPVFISSVFSEILITYFLWNIQNFNEYPMKRFNEVLFFIATFLPFFKLCILDFSVMHDKIQIFPVFCTNYNISKSGKSFLCSLLFVLYLTFLEVIKLFWSIKSGMNNDKFLKVFIFFYWFLSF